MSGIISGIILLLSVLIILFLQLTPALFAIFYHYTRGRSGQKTTDNLSLGFILGTEIFTGLVWLLAYLLVFAIFVNVADFTTGPFFWTLAGIFFALALAQLLFYFKKGKKETKLFLPRRLANTLVHRAETVKTKSDAFLLSFFAGALELIFTLPLCFLAAVLLETASFPAAPFLILIILAAVFPLFALRLGFNNHNLAEIQRARVKLKPHFRFILTFAYLGISLATLTLGVLGYGS